MKPGTGKIECMGTIRVGISGWSYPEWRGDFYPNDLAHARELEYVCSRFDTVEVNGTFYSLSRPSSFRTWSAAMPPGGIFSVKGSRYITHNKKLNDVAVPLANFLASGLLELGDNLGPILWQLPDNTAVDADRIDRFLGLLPRDTAAAAAVAAGHDDRVPEVSFDIDHNRRMRHVLEVRHEAHLTAEIARIARSHGVALAFSHASAWRYVEEITAGFVYLRLHGPGALYASEYGDDRLDWWADRIRRWKDGGQPDDARRLTDMAPPQRKERDVYVYFDNTAAGHAPRDAARLIELLEDG
jgi:uncharacterized protein YecE (DUF72 family)